MNNEEKIKIVEDALQTVYDPEMPIIDIYNLGLIYNISEDSDEQTIDILMTLTTPACPMADTIINSVENAVTEQLPDHKVNIEITFEPMWSPDKIKDEDLKRMFD